MDRPVATWKAMRHVVTCIRCLAEITITCPVEYLRFRLRKAGWVPFDDLECCPKCAEEVRGELPPSEDSVGDWLDE